MSAPRPPRTAPDHPDACWPAQLTLSDIEFGPKIGEGSFGAVWKGVLWGQVPTPASIQGVHRRVCVPTGGRAQDTARRGREDEGETAHTLTRSR
jgi:hypothetical protein